MSSRLEIRMMSGNSEMTITNGEQTMRFQSMDDFWKFEKNSEYKVTIEKVEH